MSTSRTSTVENPLVFMMRGWERFWFHPADPSTLGMIRICAGLIVFYVQLATCFDLEAFVGPKAWVDQTSFRQYREEAPWIQRSSTWREIDPSFPAENAFEREFMLRWDGLANPRQVDSKGYYGWSIWYFVTDPDWMKVTQGVILVLVFLFTIGLCTRVTSVLVWLATLSFVQRAPTILFGMDTMINIVLLYLMLGPSGAALSVDQLLEHFRKVRRARREGLPAPAWAWPTPSVSGNMALRLLQVHFCIIYMAAGLSKLQGNTWWNGTAVWGTLVNPEFCPVGRDWYMAGLRFLCEHRWLWELVMTGGVLYTLTLEIAFPFLVWDRRFRWLMVLGAVFLHTGITLFMGLSAFSLMMVTMVLSFVPAERVQWLVTRLTAPAWKRLS